MSLDDIHLKYYNDIPKDVFEKIVSADPTYRPNKMGKYGKWLLMLYKTKKLKLEDLYKATNYLTCFKNYINVLPNKDINVYKSLQALYDDIRPYMDGNAATSKSDEVRKIKEGAEKVYEDNEWLVIIPHTQEASCYYGKGTQWCTAAEHSQNMFDTYNSGGNLYINIRKSDGAKFQFHFESNSYMDATDSEIEGPICETIGMSEGLLNYYRQALSTEDFGELLMQKIEIYVNDYNTLRACKRSDEEYWFLMDDYSYITDHIKAPENWNQIYRQFYRNGYAVFSNSRGLITLIAIDNSDNFAYISSNLIDVTNVADEYSVTKPYGVMVRMTDTNGKLSFYDCTYGFTHYSETASTISKIGTVDGSDIIYVLKKDKTYDFVNIYDADNTQICGLLPLYLDYNNPFYEKEDNEGDGIIFMQTPNGEICKINKFTFEYDIIPYEDFDGE